MPEHFSWTSSDYNVDDWVWDQSNKSPEVELSSDKESVYFYTDPVQNLEKGHFSRSKTMKKDNIVIFSYLILKMSFSTTFSALCIKFNAST
jgi:hypothetical protein